MTTGGVVDRGIAGYEENRMDEETDCADDSPYCQCGEEPTEEEQMDNVCDCCGKRLFP